LGGGGLGGGLGDDLGGGGLGGDLGGGGLGGDLGGGGLGGNLGVDLGGDGLGGSLGGGDLTIDCARLTSSPTDCGKDGNGELSPIPPTWLISVLRSATGAALSSS
jgi:hypothetical protein